MRIYLVRHGQSQANVDGSYYAQTMAPIALTHKGKLQAQESGVQFAKWRAEQGLSDKKFHVFYSPMLRAKQTKDLFLEGATIGGASLRKQAIDERSSDHLTEITFGDLDGVSIKDLDTLLEKGTDVPRGQGQRPITEEDKTFIRTLREGDPYNAKPVRGLSGKDMCERARRFIQESGITNGPDDAVVVGHGYAAIALTAVLTSTDEKSCAEIYNRLAGKAHQSYLGNGEILMLDGDRTNGFTATKLPIHTKNAEASPLTAKVRKATERTYTHLTPDENGKHSWNR